MKSTWIEILSRKYQILSTITFIVFIGIVSGCEPGVPGSKEVSSQRLIKLHKATQQDIDTLAHSLDISYRLVTNIPSDKCDKEKSDGACFEVELSFVSNEKILANDWQIYFSQITPIQSSTSEWAQVKHVNGDIHKISLKEGFAGFNADEIYKLTFRANFWSLSETDALPNYIVTAEDLVAKVIDSTRVIIDQDTGLEILPYVAPYFDEEKHFKRTRNDATKLLTSTKLFERNNTIANHAADISQQIIPTPKHSAYAKNKETLNLSFGVNVQFNNIEEKQVSAALARLSLFNVKHSDSGVLLNLTVKENQHQKMGSYTLNVAKDSISIVGVDANGVFNGVQSLASLISLGSLDIPLVDVEDEPHYEFRGMLVDVSRNFHSKQFILKLLDQMAAYKLNKLHLHLADDEGWRLQIPSLPELTDVGSKRCFDLTETECLMPQLGAGVDVNSPVNGFYSVADYQEILRYASERHIQVIPSLDMPGHSRAAVKSMEARYRKYMAKEDEAAAVEFLLSDFEDTTVYSSVQYYSDNTINVCMESSYAFVKQVMLDMKKIHAEAGQPLTRYHIGADETAGAWLASPQCRAFIAKHNAEISEASQLGAYFVERIANMLAELNIEAAAWIDGLEHTNPDNMPSVIQANAWNPLIFEGHKPTHKLANNNWQIVVSSPDATYFDFPYEADPKEHGYYWASRKINTQKLFEFMPDNLPVHAEFWLDRQDLAYEADDTVQVDEQGKEISKPLNKGVKFLGIQGQLWSENTRTDNTAEYKIFPRLFALAERAWYLPKWSVPYNYDGFKYNQSTGQFSAQAKQQRDRAWSVFSETIGKKELLKLEKSNVHYRLPTVGAEIRNGELQANTAFNGLPIEYREKNGQWQRYNGVTKVNADVEIRTTTHDGTRKGRKTTVQF